MNTSQEETKLIDQEQLQLHVCPACSTPNRLDSLIKREYRCERCNLELAHLDFAANGVIRGIFGWLHIQGDIIEQRYRVKSVLGKGGFGATYLVEDCRLNGKRRALKEVPELLFDEYETTLLSQLNHPSIPDIIDRSVADGMVYLVLEFGGSQTLGSERKQHNGCIPQVKLLPWMRQLCEVLIYLHSQTPPIIHRDLKPDNILLDENGRIMLIDFGIAKESKPATMTRTIGRAATHGFSPPEQAMGTGTDERSDIYALAATFYALLTGVNPPAAHERVAGKEIIPPSQIIADISPQLEATLLQALKLNVNHRQQSVKEFSQALELIALGANNTTPHTAANTERTVLVSRSIGATNTAGLHPSSIKLPSAKISLEKSVPLSATTSSEQASKRNAIILLSGVFIVVAVALAAYLLWPKTVTDTQQTATGNTSVIVEPEKPKEASTENIIPAETTNIKESTPATSTGVSTIEPEKPKAASTENTIPTETTGIKAQTPATSTGVSTIEPEKPKAVSTENTTATGKTSIKNPPTAGEKSTSALEEFLKGQDKREVVNNDKSVGEVKQKAREEEKKHDRKRREIVEATRRPEPERIIERPKEVRPPIQKSRPGNPDDWVNDIHTIQVK